MTHERLDEVEHAAILAGLRLLQSSADRLPAGIDDIATNAGEHSQLDDEAIDDLCERINIEGLSIGAPQ